MSIDTLIEELRAGLGGASAGEWQVGHNWIFIDPIDPEKNPTHALRNILRDVSEEELQANVRHIVAAQPRNIRALLEALASLQADNLRLTEEPDDARRQLETRFEAQKAAIEIGKQLANAAFNIHQMGAVDPRALQSLKEAQLAFDEAVRASRALSGVEEKP